MWNMIKNRDRTVLTAVGSGDSGKTSTLIALAYNLAAQGHKVTVVGFDPEEESSLERLLAKTLADGVSIPPITITNILGMPWAMNGSNAEAIRVKLDEATIRHPAGFGIIRCGEDLIDHEVSGGDIYDLLKVVYHMDGIVLIDCAAGTGGFSLLSAVVASTHVIGVAKPFPKSISIAKRACGLTLNKEGENLLNLLRGTEEKSGIKFGAKYLGMVGSMFSGARLDGNQTVIAHTGISHELREYMTQIMDCPRFITHIPFIRGMDQSSVKAAHQRIATYVCGAIGLPLPSFE